MDLEEKENDETDGEVDLEGELICALRKIKKFKKKEFETRVVV